MKKICVALLCAIILTACQKELTFDDPGDGQPSGLLIRSVEVSGSDSNIAVFSYDAAKRLSALNTSASDGSIILNYSVVRNATGAISQTVAKGPQFAALGIDSLVTNFFYNASTKRYTYSRYDLLLGGTPYSDSTIFSYDATGNITRVIIYNKISMTPFVPVARIDYTYIGGNITSQKVFDYDLTTSSYNLDETINFTYDTKTNPLKLGSEAIILNLVTYFGNNNAVTTDYVDATDPTNNYSRTSTLTYNSAGKPSSGTAIENTGATNYTLRFYYN